MKSCNLLLVWVIIGIIALFGSPGVVRATNSINDDFFSKNSLVWNFENNYGSTEIQDGSLILSASYGKKFPFISLHDKLELGNKYSLDIRFKFSGDLTYGNGIVFSNTTPENNSSIELNSTNVIFLIWPEPATNYGIWTPLCPPDEESCSENSIHNVLEHSSKSSIGQWHILNISYDNGIYGVSVDNSLLFMSKNTDFKISDIWFGNYESLYTDNLWAEISIDYIKTDNNITLPTIVIPGLGASWDMGAILTGTEGTNWQIPSFVKAYDGLKNSFLNAGYSEDNDQNLFIFSYDWRRPLSVLAGRLKTYIETNVPAGVKVNLVGHSMGGLVARAYANEYGTSRINKIIAIGSPNQGTLKAYGVWEGAMVFDDSWWSKVALELTTHFGVIAGESNIQTVQRIAPSLKDLLPTYEFLAFGKDAPVAISSTNKNTYLDTLNTNFSNIDSLTTALYSDDIETDSLIKVIPHSTGDLSTWIDGKPIDNPFVKANGDGTVTDFSAKGPFSNVLLGTGWHGELVTKTENIQRIFGVLGLDQSKALSGVDDRTQNVLVAALRSPGKLEICNFELTTCNSNLGLIFPNDKLFMLPGYLNQNLILRVTEDGLGTYSVHLGDIADTAKWVIVNGNLEKPGQIDYYNIENDGQNMTVTPDKEGPSTPQITGFHNPEVLCGDTTNQHMSTVDWTNSTDKNGVVGYEYEVDYPLGNSRGKWNTFFTTSQYRGSLNEGVHYIKVRAKDRFGNFSDWSNTCAITADWTAPVVSITSPVSGTYYAHELPILKYTANDNLDSSLEITNSGMPKGEGVHTVMVTAKDDAGNTGSASITYTIKKDHLHDVCKKSGWRLFWLFRFRNQGECEKYFDRLEKIYETTHRYINVWGWR